MRNPLTLTVALLLLTASLAQGARVKDIARIQDARHNQLIGYGLVVGLEGTGDSSQTPLTAVAVRNLAAQLGNKIDLSTQFKTKNAATVVLTADLPPFVKPGDTIDVTVSTPGDARSLQGGILLQAPLQGADRRTYAVAQGPVSIGGFSAGGSGAQVTKNHPTVGRVANGAIVEREVASALAPGDMLTYCLHQPDYNTAAAMAAALTAAVPGVIANAHDASLITVPVPVEFRAHPTDFIALLGNVEVKTDGQARIVINERTGTIVVGGPVTIKPIAVAHGALTVEVKTTPIISQPLPGSQGKTVVAPDTTVTAKEGPGTLVSLQAATVDDLVRALNALHATPRDLIAILQTMKEAGALSCELEVM
jgi:flagellar P-ring protein FlgI